MKQTLWLISLTAVVTAFVTACGSAAEKPIVPAAGSVPEAPASANKLEAGPTNLAFEEILESKLPPELAQWKEISAQPRSAPSARVGDHLYVVVAGGTESVGASDITVSQVELVERPTAVNVKAVVTRDGSDAESMTSPRSYIRIPYAASLPVPAVSTQIQVKEAPAPTPAISPLTEANLPAALSGWASSTTQIPGGVARYLDGALYVMVSGGERNSGGYAVEIRSIEVRNNTVYVSALLRSPAPSAMVTMAITYPKAYAKLSASGAGEPRVIVDWQ